MLRRLQIRNYAIIDEVSIDFSPGLNIITGETGAGKSILMGALSLILGDRAETSVLPDREKKCIVEGVFDISDRKAVRDLLQGSDLDFDDELVIRREIAVSGKSRAFINDTPVNLDTLRNISSLLVDLHGQFDTLSLGDLNFQREVLDALAENQVLLQQYQQLYKEYQKQRTELNALQVQKEQFLKEFEFNKFLHDEIEEAAFKENELEEAEAELKLLSNAEGIKNLLTKISFEFNEGEQPLLSRLRSVSSQLQPYSSYHPGIEQVSSRLEALYIELQDVSGDIDHINDQVSYDPVRIDRLNERISLGYKLLKKHGVKTTPELMEIGESLRIKLEAVLDIDEKIRNLETVTADTLDKCNIKAEQLSARRKKITGTFENSVNKLLVRVGMPNARLSVSMNTVPLNENGTDNIEFLFDANKSGRMESIRKVASGGELSRLMLCIKSLVAQSVDLATLIFDEIDSGISGEAAKQVGIIMKDLSSSRQLIAITHQPQIAGKANAHFFVYKEIKGQAVKTGIRELNNDERITAIAKMLSGEKPTAAALENAREMMN